VGKYTLTLEILSSSGLPKEIFVLRRSPTLSRPDAEYKYYRISAPRDFSELSTSKVSNQNEYRVSKVEMQLTSPGQAEQIVEGIKDSINSLLFDMNEGVGALYTGEVDTVLTLTGGV